MSISVLFCGFLCGDFTGTFSRSIKSFNPEADTIRPHVIEGKDMADILSAVDLLFSKSIRTPPKVSVCDHGGFSPSEMV